MPLMRLAAATASTSAAPSVVRDVNCYCFFTYATTLLTTSTTSTTTRWFSSLGWMDWLKKPFPPFGKNYSSSRAALRPPFTTTFGRAK